MTVKNPDKPSQKRLGFFYTYENAISYTRHSRHVNKSPFSLHTDRIVSIAAKCGFLRCEVCMISHRQLREYVIQPTLNHLDLYSENAEELLVLTAAVESQGGQYLHQLGKGPACGIYQMEPATHDSLWKHYLRYKPAIADKVHDLELPEFLGDDAREMCGNLYYATAMARIFYLAKPGAIPSKNDVRGLAAYWKFHFNSHLGAGTIDKAIQAYLRYTA